MSLATKYRPTKWNDVVEQEYAVKILKNHVESNKFNSVYLFLAQAGVGKTTLARLFANKINKEKDMYLEIDGASYNSAESMRKLVDNASKVSTSSEYKIILIDEVHALSTQAFQVLLKIFEDTPKKTIFLLCTTESKKVPETIKSRSLMLRLSKITNDGLRKRLDYICEKENLDIDNDVLNYIVSTSNGGLRTAISKLEQVISADIKTLEVAKKVLDLDIDEEVLYKIVCNLNKVDVLIKYIEKEVYNQCYNVDDFKTSLQRFINDLLKYYYTKEIRYTNLYNTYSVNKEMALQLRKLLKKLIRLRVVTKETLDSLFLLFDED